MTTKEELYDVLTKAHGKKPISVENRSAAYGWGFKSEFMVDFADGARVYFEWPDAMSAEQIWTKVVQVHDRG